MKDKVTRILKAQKRTVLLAVGFISVIAFMGISCVLKVSSNVSFLFNQESRLLLNNGNEWVPPGQLNGSNLLLRKIYQTDGAMAGRINIRRENRSVLQKALEFILPPQIMIFEFSPDHYFYLIAQTDDNLNPLNAREALRKDNASFVVNTSFYVSDHNLIGELIIDGKTIGKDNGISSGFFKVVDQVPRVGPRSLFVNMPGVVAFSCQAHPSVMKSGTLFHYIISEKTPHHLSWKRKTYRNLIGERESGNIVFILSNRGALLSVKEISVIAQLIGIKNASMFDGGAALQYKFSHNNKRISFSAFNNYLSPGRRFDGYFREKIGMQFIQKSPVYLGIKLSGV